MRPRSTILQFVFFILSVNRFFHSNQHGVGRIIFAHPVDLGMDADIDSNINYLDILNIWIREPFGACICSANIYMNNRYDEVKFTAGFYETTNLVYGYMAPVVKA